MMKKTRLLSAVLWASLMTSAAVLASGCQIGCTQAGCLSGVTVDVRGLQADQPYQIDIKTPDETIQCTVDAGVDADGFRRMACDNTAFYYSGSQGVSIDIDDTPARVEITVRQGETVRAEHDVEPRYTRSAPNGEQCGPVCHHASIPVQL